MEIELSTLMGSCPCGQTHSLSVRGIWIGRGELSRLPTLLAGNGWRSPVVLSDQNTWEAAGREVLGLLGRNGHAVILNPNGLHADEHGVETARGELPDNADVLIAAGSGTIHDITRFLAQERGTPFISVPTAASVDGFVSTVAAMTWHGCKKTVTAVAPLYVLADSSIFATAPRRLNASGAADLLGKFTALCDWRIAALMTGEYLCDRICGLEEQAMKQVCGCLAAIAEGEEAACEKLMEGLLLSGLAMQMMGNSRPASGSEHHLSHFWEMEIINGTLDAYHGEKVGVGLLLASRAYHAFERALRRGQVVETVYSGLDIEEMSPFLQKPEMSSILLEENKQDPLGAIQSGLLLERCDAVCEILEQLPSEESLCSYLAQVGAPTSLGEIGLTENKRRDSLRLSPYVRNRLTLMRLFKRYGYLT